MLPDSGRRIPSLVALILVGLFGDARAQAPSQPPPDLDAQVARALATFDVPGVALAIVKDGDVVVARGYGVRSLETPDPVDGETLFAIASNTKVFTAVGLALLVEEGRLEWDAPVVRYLPWFRLSDPYVTQEITVRDLLVHRSGLGLGAGDLLWWPPSTYDRDEIVRRLRFLPLAASFRSTYAYDNVLYLVAGEVIEAVSGRSWEDFITARILDPVGMRTSEVRHSAVEDGGNIAAPHAAIDGVVQVISPFTSDNTNPAGGIVSSAGDMARWVGVLLADGRLPDGTRLFSEASARELTTIVTPMPITEPAPELAAERRHFYGYALGLRVQDYRGRRVVSHTGGLPGYVSRVTLVPDLGLGVVVLTNQEVGAAYQALTNIVLDHHLDAHDTDWIAAYEQVRARERREARPPDTNPAADANASGPSLSLDGYAGTFRDAWYGDVTVVKEGSGLVLRFSRTPALVGDLEHWQYDTFVVRWRDRQLRGDAYVTYQLTASGGIDRVKLAPVSPDTDFSFDFQDLLLQPVDP